MRANIAGNRLESLAPRGKQGDIGTTGESVVHGGEQIRIHEKLQNITETTGFEAGGDDGRVLESSQEDNPGFGRAALELASDFNAANARHGNVQDGEVGIKFDDRGESICTIGDEGDNVESRSQQSVCGVENMSKIIGDEDAM